MRLFVSANLPASWKSTLSRAVQTAQKSLSLKWTDASQAHLTLAFLGETAPDRIPLVRAALKEVSAGAAPFSLSLGNPGAFPKPSKPGIFWLSVLSAENHLENLAKRIQDSLISKGLPCDAKPFKSHVTLARSAQGNRTEKSRTSYEQFCTLFENFETEPFTLRSIELMESRLLPSGARHDKLESFELGSR